MTDPREFPCMDDRPDNNGYWTDPRRLVPPYDNLGGEDEVDEQIDEPENENNE